jgi:hypothetical protein
LARPFAIAAQATVDSKIECIDDRFALYPEWLGGDVASAS